ncbi:MAG: hypothetical protein NUW12_03335 [Firmicutes bacterium]|jgi:hypothetical protein|nr:hypothetical protein [Bacillota bacterium]MDH7495004.1 hypothetical protein [Bacillota bacterium]
MRRIPGVATASWAAFVCLFGVLVALGLNLAQRAEADLRGVDMPAPCVGVERENDGHAYVVFLLGKSCRLDIEDELAFARRARLRAFLAASECARWLASATRRTTRATLRVLTRFGGWLGRLGDPSSSGGDRVVLSSPVVPSSAPDAEGDGVSRGERVIATPIGEQRESQGSAG